MEDDIMVYGDFTKRLYNITTAYVFNTGKHSNPYGLARLMLEDEEEVYEDCKINDVIGYASVLLRNEIGFKYHYY
jgi:hypothetical protein